MGKSCNDTPKITRAIGENPFPRGRTSPREYFASVVPLIRDPRGDSQPRRPDPYWLHRKAHRLGFVRYRGRSRICDSPLKLSSFGEIRCRLKDNSKLRENLS
jgi:hypothetical protein